MTASFLRLFFLQVNKRRPYHSINFVIAHDGFTLRDLVSYNLKVPRYSFFKLSWFIKTFYIPWFLVL